MRSTFSYGFQSCVFADVTEYFIGNSVSKSRKVAILDTLIRPRRLLGGRPGRPRGSLRGRLLLRRVFAFFARASARASSITRAISERQAYVVSSKR